MGEEYIYYITETKNNKKNGTSIQYDADGNILGRENIKIINWMVRLKNMKKDGLKRECIKTIL